ncbi:CDP-alcohol phosphatidyltransferase family protein [Microbacterium koreense]|uniref:CDP-alcohol phosphatidyltransferase family protein n=1 Tax=Microbacterium koreense TaxID=323761 RepID=A0ABW2ZPD6_9MICO
MSATSPRAAAPEIRRARPSARALTFALLSAVYAVGVVCSGVALGLPAPSVVVAVGAFVLASVVCGILLRSHHGHVRLGAANAVTLLRLGIVAVLIAILLAPLAAPAVVMALATVALCLDGVDGFLARRQGLQSRFGAAFDMEVDSALALVLSVLAAFGPAGPLALLLGLPRYVFGAAALALPWINAPLAARFSRKAICVFQIIALIVLQLPTLPSWAALSIVGVTLALVAWSFTVDIFQARAARTRSTT